MRQVRFAVHHLTHFWHLKHYLQPHVHNWEVCIHSTWLDNRTSKMLGDRSLPTFLASIPHNSWWLSAQPLSPLSCPSVRDALHTNFIRSHCFGLHYRTQISRSTQHLLLSSRIPRTSQRAERISSWNGHLTAPLNARQACFEQCFRDASGAGLQGFSHGLQIAKYIQFTDLQICWKKKSWRSVVNSIFGKQIQPV